MFRRKEVQCCNVQKKKGPVLQCSRLRPQLNLNGSGDRWKALRVCSARQKKREVQRRGLYYIETLSNATQ